MCFDLEMVWIIKGGSSQLDFFFFLRTSLDKARGLPHEIGSMETDEIAAV